MMEVNESFMYLTWFQIVDKQNKKIDKLSSQVKVSGPC